MLAGNTGNYNPYTPGGQQTRTALNSTDAFFFQTVASLEMLTLPYPRPPFPVVKDLGLHFNYICRYYSSLDALQHGKLEWRRKKPEGLSSSSHTICHKV